MNPLFSFMKNYVNNYSEVNNDLIGDCCLCSLTDCKLKFTKGLTYESSVCNKRGMIYDLVNKLDGLSSDQFLSIIQSIKSLPEFNRIMKFHDELQNDKQVLALLNKNFGITNEMVEKWYLGYDNKKKYVVIPILYSHQKDILALKYKCLDTGADIKTIHSENVFGWNRKLVDNSSELIITSNEYLTMHLRELNFSAVNYFDNSLSWLDQHGKIIPQNIIVFADNMEDALNTLSGINNFIDAESNIKLLYPNMVSENFNTWLTFFTSGNATSEQLQKCITESQFTKLETIKLLFENAVDSQQQKKDLNLAQDYVDGMLVYGIQYGGDQCILTSKREVIKTSQLNYTINVSKLDVSRISSGAVNEYLSFSKRIKISDLYSDISNYLREFIYFSRDDTYSILVLWIIGTYLFRVFRHFPYLHIQAEKGSGKSTLFELLKPICFNAAHYLNSTPAVLFHDSHNLSRTMLLDEVEQLKQGNKSSHQAVISLLNAGYGKSGRVPRVQGKEIIQYNVYCPKAFAGINELDDVLGSRSINIKMIKPPKDVKLNPIIQDELFDDRQKGLRENLYMVGLSYAENAALLYKDGVKQIPFLKDMPINRSLDLYTPLFIIANIIDQESGDLNKLTTELNEYRKFDEEFKRLVNLEANPTAIRIKALAEMSNELKPVKDELYKTSDVLEFFIGQKVYPPKTTINKLTIDLKMLGFNVEVYKDSISKKAEKAYRIDLVKLKELVKRYDLEES